MSKIYVDEIRHSGGAVAAINLDSSGNVDINGNDLILDADGDTKISASTDDVMTFDTAGSERMRITASGDVFAKTVDARIGSDVGSVEYGTSTANSVRFYSSDTEAMRIDSSGTVSFHGISGRATGSTGHMSISEQSDNRSYVECATSTTSGRTLLAFVNPNGAVGSILVSGGSTSYNTSSDYRLKENVTADWDATTRLKQLNPVRFNFISDADTTVDGFLAHEVQDVVPEAISGTKDAVDDEGNPVYQGIDQSKLVPLLVKTIQELEARITALENA